MSPFFDKLKSGHNISKYFKIVYSVSGQFARGYPPLLEMPLKWNDIH